MDLKKIKDILKNNKKNIILGLIILLFLLFIIINNVIKNNIYKNNSTSKASFFYAKITKMPSLKINGEKVSYAEYFKLFNSLYNFYEKQSKEIEDKTIPSNESIKSEVITKLVKNSVLESLAKKYDIEVTDKEVFDKIKNLNSETGSMEITEGLIKENYNIDLNDFKEYFIKPIILKEKISEAISNDEKLNKDAIKKINDINKRLVESNGIYTSKTGQKIDLFYKIAREESEDLVSAENDGDLGWLYSNSTEEIITNTALALEKNEISEIIKSSSGYHIIRLIDKVDNIDIPKFRIAHIFVQTINVDSYIQEKVEKAKVKAYIK